MHEKNIYNVTPEKYIYLERLQIEVQEHHIFDYSWVTLYCDVIIKRKFCRKNEAKCVFHGIYLWHHSVTASRGIVKYRGRKVCINGNALIYRQYLGGRYMTSNICGRSMIPRPYIKGSRQCLPLFHKKKPNWHA